MVNLWLRREIWCNDDAADSLCEMVLTHADNGRLWKHRSGTLLNIHMTRQNRRSNPITIKKMMARTGYLSLPIRLTPRSYNSKPDPAQKAMAKQSRHNLPIRWAYPYITSSLPSISVSAALGRVVTPVNFA